MRDWNGVRFVASYSGGKDSVLAIHRAICQGMVLQALIITYNTDLERSWFHGVPPDILAEVEQSVGVPVQLIRTAGADYNANFERALLEQKKLGAQACVFGDIDIEGHLQWGIERCNAAGVEACFPLWKENRESLVRECISCGFVPYITVVDTKRLSADFLGHPITPQVMDRIKDAGADVCGENGEYHTFVMDGPIFAQPLPIEFSAPQQHGGYAVQPMHLRK